MERNMFLNKPKCAIVKKRNFWAKLPNDFVILKGVWKNNEQLLREPIENWEMIWCDKFHFKTEQFFIGEDKIFFSGKFSKYWMIRQMQKLWEYFFPEKYKIEYITHW
jgi:hypothetical protein